jgi:TonB-linked SusC/RagA family outer membrane protein
MRKMLSLLTVLSMSAMLVTAQVRTVTGRVTDEKGDAVPFATVTLKGSKNGVAADANGNFSIKAKTGDVLVFSAQGLDNKEATVGAGSTVGISMAKNNKALEEVVVTGAYNTKRTQRSTSYNAQVVTGEQLNTIRQTNINNALAGKVSGIQVRSQSAAKLNSNGNIRLRGASGLGGDEGIIYVVDGTILPNPNDINMDEVDDVSVLQGPAASALFGSQGANGAIVITTKKGKKGPGIGVDVNLGAVWEKVYIVPNYQNSYGGGSTADMIRYTWQPNHPVEWKALDGKYYADYSDDASWGPRMVGQEYIPWYSWYGGHADSYKTARMTAQPDNGRDYFNTGVTLNNSVAFTKATDNASFRFGYQNVDIKGLLPTTSLKKNQFTFNTSVNLTPRLTIAANINYVTQTTRGEFDDGYSNQTTGSFNQWFHRNLDMGKLRELKDLRTPDGTWASWNHANPNSYDPANPRAFYAGNYWYNFYTWFDLVKPVQGYDRIFGDASLAYKITNDLRIKGTVRKNINSAWSETRYSSDLLQSGIQTQGNCPECRGFYGTSSSKSDRQNVELLLTYSKKINDFTINANAGSDFFRWDFKGNSASTNNGLNVPNLYTIANSKDAPSVGNDRVQEKYRALYATAGLGYKNFLFFDATIRNDWYSTLPKGANDVMSKSFGASFVFTDLVKIPGVSFGKVRASWGEIPKALGTSSTTFGAYRYPGFAYGVGQFQWNGNFLMGTPNEVVDSAIRGAVATQKEIGLEMKFLKNRLGFAVTYWDATEKDFPRSVSVNGASGFTSKLINTGEITKKGVDVQFNARPVVSKNFEWTINATWSYLLENKVVSIAPGTPRLVIEGLWGTTGPRLVHTEGQTWGQIWGNGIKRNADGVPMVDANGFFMSDPEKYYGSVLPRYTGGIQNSFVLFKDFIINANIDYQSGGKFFSLSNMWGSYSGLTARTAVVNEKGNPIRNSVADGGGIRVVGVDVDNKPVERYVEAQDYFHNLYNNRTFDPYIYDLTFVKLREVSVGYQIPVKKLGIDSWMQRATFSLIFRNPILIYAKTEDFDPSEISNLSGEAGNLPGTRGIGFNLRVGF